MEFYDGYEYKNKDFNCRIKVLAVGLGLSQIVLAASIVVFVLLRPDEKFTTSAKQNDFSSINGVLIIGGSKVNDDIFEMAFRDKSGDVDFCSIDSAWPGRDLFGAVGFSFDDVVIFCGGSSNAKCFSLSSSAQGEDDEWRETDLIGFEDGLQYAASLRLSKDEYWVVGGRNGSKVALESTWIFDRRFNGFALGAKLPEPRYGHCLLRLSPEAVFLVGGRPLSTTAFIGRFESNSKTVVSWFPQREMSTHRDGAACAVLDDRHGNREVFVAGGSGLDTSEIFELDKGRWRQGPRLLRPFHYGLGIKWSKTEMVLLGGRVIDDDVVDAQDSDEVSVYDHRESVWRHSKRMRRKRAYFAGVALQSPQQFCASG